LLPTFLLHIPASTSGVRVGGCKGQDYNYIPTNISIRRQEEPSRQRSNSSPVVQVTMDDDDDDDSNDENHNMAVDRINR
jgi:hypothetical protein